ncbi:hypothetical protein Zmor_006244 [Zophobas morio]|uniref:ZMYM2-like/QRICH1 C-terminal domain-containing protein n=1 Tax=Zophobas morio TaxID=2755281 RepID=A0AA38ML88_9CUCU|nr:hypothetical protein Zmor_006244 [Zophobas morio]
MCTSKRFGSSCFQTIDEAIINSNIPENTKKSKKSAWKQFNAFCQEKNYVLDHQRSIEEIANILKDWGYNMRRKNGEEYKECVVKTLWNVVAKEVQEMYDYKYNIKFNPFSDSTFNEARRARDAKRKTLQSSLKKRRSSSTVLSGDEIRKMVTAWNEDTPAGLQKKFYQISAYELAWRGGEAANCLLHYFKIEKNNKGEETGRIEYNSVFSKTTQGGAKPLANSKWLIANKDDLNICPVRLFKKLSSKRTTNITTERFFLTPNPQWQNDNSPWYKNCPVGKNETGKWTKLAAEKIGLDVCNINITNHSNRATAVSHLAKSGLDEQQIIKITGHASTSSLAPYLEIDTEHHEQIIKKMRLQEKESNTVVSATNELQAKASSNSIYNYNKCTFIFHSDSSK